MVLSKKTAMDWPCGLYPGLAALSLAIVALLVACAPALAKNRLVGEDGKIHACYRVKGQPKGALRVVRGMRPHCRRGERQVAWTVAGAVGPTGSAGAQGADGPTGQTGTQVTVDAGLLEEVKLLSGRVEELESTLNGVTNSDLTGMLATLQGLTNEDLVAAVNALPVVEAVCEQSETLTEQVNLLQEVLSGLKLEGVLGGILKIPSLPEELETFSCPSL